MTPILTPEQMRAVDAGSPVPVDELIERAGTAVARAAIGMMGGTYGRHVTVLAGPGNNGADGRVAARVLANKGVRVSLVEIGRHLPAPAELPACDLVVDAAFGTGMNRPFVAPHVEARYVLAVDIPSGLDALTGVVRSDSRVLRADRTVTFAAPKVGMYLGRGPELCGEIDVVDIGLPVGNPDLFLFDESDAIRLLPKRPADAHKWRSGLLVVAGSAGMTGAAALAARSAQRGGAGVVRLGVPGEVLSGTEAVGVSIPAEHWGGAAIAATEKCRAVVVGPGLGRTRSTVVGVRQLLAKVDLPLVVDGDGLFALTDDRPNDMRADALGKIGTAPVEANVPLSPGSRAIVDAQARRLGTRPATLKQTVAAVRSIDASFETAARLLEDRRPSTTVLTPHDGEFERLTRKLPGHDRVDAVRRFAGAIDAVVLLKGPTTVISAPTGMTYLVNSGDQRLATAGTGDVLSGLIGSFLAQGLPSLEASALGAFIHGRAAQDGRRFGFVAGDLPDLIADYCEQLAAR